MSIVKIRERIGARLRGEESGFTLVELLVVMLILGLLAAIAIPAFFDQRNKARDADAKSLARTAQTAIETFATDNGGSYQGVGADEIIAIEPTLTNAEFAEGTPSGTQQGYVVTVVSDTGNEFTITRADGTGEDPAGTIRLTCTEGGNAGCPTGGDWGGGSGGGGDEEPE